jgi:hypothetical protein
MVNQLRVIDKNEESIYDFDSSIYMNHKISRVCLSPNLQDYSCQLKLPMVNQLRVIDKNEESIYDFDSGIYMNHKISRVCP